MEKHIGCDGVVGSGRVLDACGECGGNNSTCQIISGIFTEPYLEAGYRLVVQIPAGACTIRIEELGATKNYLALRDSKGKFIINGDWNIDMSGSYGGAGASFAYQRQPARGELISAQGPITEPVDIFILYRQANRGIKYEYAIKRNASLTSVLPRLPTDTGVAQWVVTGYTECSKSCGGGTRTTEVVCMKRKRKQLAPDRWEPGAWSACSVTCGSGRQTRSLRCVSDGQQVAPSLCPGEPPAPESQTCLMAPCPVGLWQIGAWSPCSVSCGWGSRRRQCSVECGQGVQWRQVTCGGNCDAQRRPEETRPCKTDRRCAGTWFTGPWSRRRLPYFSTG
ncbi:ADAMTS-like protein 4 [Pollicipes pollicipes]|uniref:ADAMTS-like protein 4 n=1 Tax=Pollicipes pollicipes TaxID=41117 RepID=UPI001884D9FB|nr:ADAMTS-like protein 4 [Pollicipes pollicipes]